MQYNAPYGSPDPNAPYVDRNTAAGTSGSRVPAAALEHPQREIMAVLAAAGVTGSSDDLTQLLQAIQFLIAAATGGGDTSNFVLMPAARSRIPIFPEVLTADGRIPVTSPSAGQVRVPAGYDFLHRGIFAVTTVQTDFATVANKTYHLRWSPVAGFALKDLADSGYNPTALAETNEAFDSLYDNMLVARVVTNASNVPTITNLVNLNRLEAEVTTAGPGTAAGDNISYSNTFTLNWSRTPKAQVVGSVVFTGTSSVGSGQTIVNQVLVGPKTRYQVTATITADLDRPGTSAYGQLQLFAMR
ncbi:hypothetical protein [Rhizobium laguerreae]|uniref:hypothetical protein n=1 Tax=Rhizobium laguerreae TaxID=1076926 RepID=UPI003007F536